jgi:hypothetical protein
MANTFTISGNSTFTNPALASLSLTTTYTPTSSLGIGSISTNLTSSGWTALDTGSVPTLIYGTFNNEDFTSSILLSQSASGQNPLCIIQPQGTFIWAWSGSYSLYGKSTGSNQGNNPGNVQLNYQLIPL